MFKEDFIRMFFERLVIKYDENIDMSIQVWNNPNSRSKSYGVEVRESNKIFKYVFDIGMISFMTWTKSVLEKYIIGKFEEFKSLLEKFREENKDV
jgi:hypothetical protein